MNLHTPLSTSSAEPIHMPHPADIEVGRRIRLRRKQLGLSQTQLGLLIGPVTFQQVQKYEKGRNRVGPSRLIQIAAALDVPVGFFFPPETAAMPKAADMEKLLDRFEERLGDLLAAVRDARKRLY